jgi:protein-tyrosine phosphatase
MTAPIERRIRLQGSYNFRDIGGYASANGQTVRWKRLYRSDALHLLTPEDLEILQPLGVSTLLDLRSLAELELTGHSQLVSEQGAIHRHVPFVQDLDDHIDLTEFPPMSDLYIDMLNHGADALCNVFLALTESATYPAVVHCAAGKDRTGMTVALVLRTLNVSDDDIAVDYALTHGFYKEYNEIRQAMGQGPLFEGLPPELLMASPELILGLLQVIDERYGSSEQFLLECGVPQDAFAEIRNQLLEECPHA